MLDRPNPRPLARTATRTSSVVSTPPMVAADDPSPPRPSCPVGTATTPIGLCPPPAPHAGRFSVSFRVPLALVRRISKLLFTFPVPPRRCADPGRSDARMVVAAVVIRSLLPVLVYSLIPASAAVRCAGNTPSRAAPGMAGSILRRRTGVEDRDVGTPSRTETWWYEGGSSLSPSSYSGGRS